MKAYGNVHTNYSIDIILALKIYVGQSRTQSPRLRNEGSGIIYFVFPTSPGDPILLHTFKFFKMEEMEQTKTHLQF